VDAEWEKAGQRTTGSLVLDKDFTVGVFGESAILQATAIPSVMLLPGFLLVTTLILLIKASWKTGLLQLDLKKPEFWFFSITVSLVIFLLYPWLSGPLLSVLFRQPVSSRDYIQGYGFYDILLLWLGAILLGCLIWAVGSAGLWLGLRIRERRREALVPNKDDEPFTILRKIAANRQGFDLQEVRYPRDTGTQPLFLLPSGFPEPGKVWVAPRIQLRWLKDDDDLKDEFEDLQSEPQDIQTLINTLEGWRKPPTQVIILEWDQGGGAIQGPVLVDEAQVVVLAASDTFITSV
jgi:hypothetical protein